MSDITKFAMPHDFDLRDCATEAPVVPLEERKLGLKGVHTSRLNLRDFVLDGAPAPPPAVHRSHLELIAQGHLPCWLNNLRGDCVEEMILHSIEMFHADAGTPIPLFILQDAEHLYELMGQWNPENPEATDLGTDENVAMGKWEEGLPLSDGNTHTIAGTVAVNPQDTDLVKRAIWDCVCPQMAYELPLTAQAQAAEWFVTGPPTGNAAKGSWGGHGVPLVSYDPYRIRFPSWGGDLLMRWGFHVAYAVECHAVITREMENRSGVSPAGINWTALNEAQKALAA
jgi:hypothetical protein